MRALPNILLLFFLSQALHAEKTEISAMAWPALSPDGGTLAFEWLNDIWLAPGNGGEAKRVVKHSSRSAYPDFTPDGKRLVFSSDRSGSVQLYSVKTDGSDLRKHSDNTEGNILEAVSPDGTYALVRGERERSGFKPFRILKTALKKDSRELPLFDATAHSVSISPDGEKVLFCRGSEQMYRSGYTGSRASQIHLHDMVEDSFVPVIAEEHEAKSPLWCAEGNSFYYTSSRNGVFNIWKRNLADGTDRQLTFFKDDGVVLRAISGNTKIMVFRAGKKVYRFEPESDNEPREISFHTNETLPERGVRKEKISGTSNAAFLPKENRIVFSAAGDLWTMARNQETPDRLADTDGTDERELVISPDGETLYFLKDDGLRVAVCKSAWSGKMSGDAEILPTGPRSKRSLRISPDGSSLSWLEATGDLVTIPTAGGESRIVMNGWDMPTYDWSPDGKWLVVAAKDIHANRDIFIVAADGSLPPFNLTSHPAFDGSPKWSPDGRTIVFVSRRERDGLARLMTARVGKRLRSVDAYAKEFDEIVASVRPLDTDVSEPIRVVWSPDSKSVLFQSREAGDKTVYSVSLVGGAVSEYAVFRGLPAGRDMDGKTFWRIGRVPSVFDGKETMDFKFSFSVEQDRDKRLRLGFRRIWRTLGERFYDETMNGKDWPAILGKYEDAAAGALNSTQFDRVVAQLLGELNASHLTFRTNPWGVRTVSEKLKKPTSHPGLVFNNSWQGPLVVERVVAGSPISKVPGAPIAGDTVLRIAGKEVDARTPLGLFFNGAAGSPLPIVVSSKKGGSRTLELVPVSYAQARSLDQEEKERASREAAEAGGHRIAYLPFKRMKSDDLLELSTEVYRASIRADGLILDLRDNAGGRVADQLLGLFCQPVHTFTIPRGGSRGYPADRRVSPSWDGPMVVLCNENTFSNAEIFCRAFKQLGRGKLVGTPTNGGVISAVNITIPEVGELQIPFRGWFDAETGRDLELNGAKPDVIVPLLPADQVAGRDPQLEAAVGLLSGQLAGKGEAVKAILKSDRESDKR